MKKQIFLTLVMLIVLSNFVFSAEFVGSLSTKMKPSRLTDNKDTFEVIPEDKDNRDFEDDFVEVSKKNQTNESKNITIDLSNKEKQPEKEKISEKEIIKFIEKPQEKKGFFESINWATIIMTALIVIVILIIHEFIKNR